MWIFNPVQNSDRKYDQVVLRIPELFSITPAFAVRCWQCRMNGYMSQVLRVFKIKGFPQVGTFPHALPQCGNDPGCSGESPLPPSWGPWSGHEPWVWQTCPASTPEPWPSWVILKWFKWWWGWWFFSFFNLPLTFLLLSPGVLFGTKPFQMENQTADESDAHPEP